MKLMKAMLCAVILGAFSVPAVAAPAVAKKPTPTKQKKAVKSKHARKGKTRVAAKNKRQRIKKYDFLGDELHGDIVSPDGEDLRFRGDAKLANLIEFRLSFLPEITQAAENL